MALGNPEYPHMVNILLESKDHGDPSGISSGDYSMESIISRSIDIPEQSHRKAKITLAIWEMCI